MKIVRQTNTVYKEFGDINEGEVFDYCGETYMKISEIMSFGGDTLNAINLKTTEIRYFSYDEKVLHLPQAELKLIY